MTTAWGEALVEGNDLATGGRRWRVSGIVGKAFPPYRQMLRPEATA